MIKVNFKGTYLLISGDAQKLNMQYPLKAVRTICLNPIKLWKKKLRMWNAFPQNKSDDIRNIPVLPKGSVEGWVLLYCVFFNLNKSQSRLWPWLTALYDSNRPNNYACICNCGMSVLRFLRNYQKLWPHQKFTVNRDWFFTFICDSWKQHQAAAE